MSSGRVVTDAAIEQLRWSPYNDAWGKMMAIQIEKETLYQVRETDVTELVRIKDHLFRVGLLKSGHAANELLKVLGWEISEHLGGGTKPIEGEKS